MNPANKVLVYLIGSLGDTIVAIPALRAVRRHFPDSELVLLQNVQSGNLIKASQVIPDNLIDRYLSYDSEADKFNKITGFFRLWGELRRERFQAAVYLVVSERPAKAALRDKLFFRSCGIRSLFGFHAFSKAELYPVDAAGQPSITENEAIRKLKRLQMDGIQFAPEDLRQPLLNYSAVELEVMNGWLGERRKKPGSRLVAIAPRGKKQTNEWPTENFIELGRRLIEMNFELLVSGGSDDRETGEEMTAVWGEGINAAGEFNVRESGALLSRCDFYVGLDTGTAHLAAASGIRCFVIFGGRTNLGQWFPLGDGHSVVFHPVPCAGCRLFVCPLPHHPCMMNISVDAVWQNLQRFMQKDTSHSPSEAIEVTAV